MPESLDFSNKKQSLEPKKIPDLSIFPTIDFTNIHQLVVHLQLNKKIEQWYRLQIWEKRWREVYWYDPHISTSIGDTDTITIDGFYDGINSGKQRILSDRTYVYRLSSHEITLEWIIGAIPFDMYYEAVRRDEKIRKGEPIELEHEKLDAERELQRTME